MAPQRGPNQLRFQRFSPGLQKPGFKKGSSRIQSLEQHLVGRRQRRSRAEPSREQPGSLSEHQPGAPRASGRKELIPEGEEEEDEEKDEEEELKSDL